MESRLDDAELTELGLCFSANIADIYSFTDDDDLIEGSELLTVALGLSVKDDREAPGVPPERDVAQPTEAKTRMSRLYHDYTRWWRHPKSLSLWSESR